MEAKKNMLKLAKELSDLKVVKLSGCLVFKDVS